MDVSCFAVPFLMKELGMISNNNKLETAQDIVLFLKRSLKFESAKVYQLSYCGPDERSATLCRLLTSFHENLNANTVLTPLSIGEFSEALSPAPDGFVSNVILKKTISGDCFFWGDDRSLLGAVEIVEFSEKIIFKLENKTSVFSKNNHLYFCSLLPLLISCCFCQISSDIKLRSRESEVLKWAMLGKSTEEIALILSLSESTVKFHFNNIYKKLNVTSRTQAVAKAIQYGLVSVPLQ